MTVPVTDPAFWAKRLSDAPADSIHRSVFECHTSLWKSIEDRHRRILGTYIDAGDSVLDVGCAYGRMINLMPQAWHLSDEGRYVGVDICPQFIDAANNLHPGWYFDVCSAACLPYADDSFDWAVLISVRRMLLVNTDLWPSVELELLRAAQRLLILEYTFDPDGEVVCREV